MAALVTHSSRIDPTFTCKLQFQQHCVLDMLALCMQQGIKLVGKICISCCLLEKAWYPPDLDLRQTFGPHARILILFVFFGLVRLVHAFWDSLKKDEDQESHQCICTLTNATPHDTAENKSLPCRAVD